MVCRICLAVAMASALSSSVSVLMPITSPPCALTCLLYTSLQGTELAQAAFKASLGSAGMAFVAICMLFFAFSTIIGWYFFGEQNVKALFGHKAVKVYAAIVVICIVIGSALHVDLVWNLSDLFNGLMVFPNLIALLALSGLVAKAAHDKDIMK